jgi:hypothetical protein
MFINSPSKLSDCRVVLLAKAAQRAAAAILSIAISDHRRGSEKNDCKENSKQKHGCLLKQGTSQQFLNSTQNKNQTFPRKKSTNRP